VGPHATLRVRYALEKLGPNETADPRPAAERVAARDERVMDRDFPMEGAGPRDPRRDPARRPPIERHRGQRDRDRGRDHHEDRYGTLAVRVQPADAEVLIDGERWEMDPGGRLEVQLAAGRHHVEVRRRDTRPVAQDIEVRPGDVTPLNVSLAAEGGR